MIDLMDRLLDIDKSLSTLTMKQVIEIIADEMIEIEDKQIRKAFEDGQLFGTHSDTDEYMNETFSTSGK